MYRDTLYTVQLKNKQKLSKRVTVGPMMVDGKIIRNKTVRFIEIVAQVRNFMFHAREQTHFFFWSATSLHLSYDTHNSNVRVFFFLLFFSFCTKHFVNAVVRIPSSERIRILL